MAAFPGSGDRPERGRLHSEKQLTLLSFLHSHSEYVRAEVSPRAPCLYSSETEINCFHLDGVSELPVMVTQINLSELKAPA